MKVTTKVVLMKIAPTNILYHEIIGLKISVIGSSDESLNCISGEVIDETKNTLKVNTSRGVRIIPKATVKLKIQLPEGSHTILEGDKITYRSEDRIGRMRRES